MRTQKEYIDIVNHALAQIEYPAFPAKLYEPIAYAIAAGGKRLRPVLLLASADAFDGEIDHCIWPALGIEMFHNFTLVHDDVMDHADMRRGRETVCKKYGLNAAILSGDAMVSLAYQCMAGCPPMFLPEVIDRFGLMAMKVYEGQQIDEDFESAESITMQQYLQMVVGKTSALIAYPCAIGALIAGAEPADISAMFDFGTSLGIAFQLQDDYLDVYGDPATFGKAVGGDILNDKKTWLHIIASEQDSDGEYARLCQASLAGQEKIDAYTALYDKRGLRASGPGLIARYTADAIEALRSTSMSADEQQWFVDLAHSLLGREQ